MSSYSDTYFNVKKTDELPRVIQLVISRARIET